MSPRDDATQRQVDAARPDRSTWLSANAGSGKTRVLTDRVARLLLDGVNPQNILCLTYTKAAASEMQNRLFQRLGEWAMLPDDNLRQALWDLGIEESADADRLRQARRLFASAIETPGGLKIQTIHSFCATILRRFPLEAEVSPQFTEIDERNAALLQRELLEAMATGPHAPHVEALARQVSGEGFEPLIQQILDHRDEFEHPFSEAALVQALGPQSAPSKDQLLSDVFMGDERALLDRLIPALLGSGPQDLKAGDKLSEITRLDLSALPILESVFLFGEKTKAPFQAKIDKFPTKGLAASLADIMPQLHEFMLRIEQARQPRLILDVIEKTKTLHDFAHVFLGQYKEVKQRYGWLDFDDLIAYTHRLLTVRDAAAWVLFRLDGGIDHILVDEAQDTSPLQWKVIESLAQEFTSGSGARADVNRTIFVVGDKKQSIYSFQGADPREFDRMRQEFGNRLEQTGNPLQSMQMAYSFRSSQAILSAVDACFDGAESSGFTSGQEHLAFHQALPGRVDLWPVIEKPDALEEPDWHDPVDVPAQNDPSIELAEKISQYIKYLVDVSHPIHDPKTGWRPIRPGDFLILVQRRKLLFQELISACKRVDLPVAGADRLKIGGELAVRDIAALLAFLATPEDNLSLASALKSPLFGWDEAQLYDLAHGRRQRYLWAELRDRAKEFPETMEILDDLRKQAEYLRPYELIERVLTRHHGRRHLLARLGAEAEDGIDALLAQALLYESKSVDSLTGFLVWLQTDDIEVKRQLDEAGDRVRVMTVHGAKGLESPVVILPETMKRRIDNRSQVMTLAEQPVWKPSRADAPAALCAEMDAHTAAVEAERDRLLYVAMTRAETWLIVAGAGDVGQEGQSWYRQIEAGLKAVGAQPHTTPIGPGLRYTQGAWPANASSDSPKDPPVEPTLGAHFTQSAPQLKPAPATLSPSDLGGAKALSGDAGLDSDAATERGAMIHQLLEILPQLPETERATATNRMLPHLTDDDRTDLLQEALSVLNAPDLATLFAPDALAEVPITAPLTSLGGRRIHGVIDRLIIRDGSVLAVDFKSNATVPQGTDDVPEGLMRQMGAYAEALTQIYPNHKVEVAILWTRTAQFMPLPHDRVIAALKRSSIS